MLGLLVLSWVAFVSLAEARPWKPAMKQLASDYATIIDDRNARDIKVIFWLAPPILDSGPAADLVDKYVIIGVARAFLFGGQRDLRSHRQLAGQRLQCKAVAASSR